MFCVRDGRLCIREGMLAFENGVLALETGCLREKRHQSTGVAGLQLATSRAGRECLGSEGFCLG